MEKTKGVCPVCDGTTRRPVPESQQQYKTIYAGYDAETDTLECDNCGGQYQWGRACGQVSLNHDGVPCRHEYRGQNAGRCLTTYTCIHCDDRHQIDSGD